MIRYILFSILALLFGITIVMVSLIMSSQRFATKKLPMLYKNDPITRLMSSAVLPGTPIYPLLMMRDWVKLHLTFSDTTKFDMSLAYADRRMEYAKILSQIGEGELTVSTSSKAELYLGKAKLIVDRSSWSDEQKNMYKTQLLWVLKEHEEILDHLSVLLTDQERSHFDAVINYNSTLQSELAGQQ